jgi:hypothetical protein
VNVRIPVLLEQQFGHAAARSAGAADADGGRFWDFGQPAAQFRQGDVAGAGRVGAGVLSGAAYIQQRGAALLEFRQQAGNFAGVSPIGRNRYQTPLTSDCSSDHAWP